MLNLALLLHKMTNWLGGVSYNMPCGITYFCICHVKEQYPH
jgi:hypothetical protein